MRTSNLTAAALVAAVALGAAVAGCGSDTREKRHAGAAAAALTSASGKDEKKKPKLEEVKPDKGDLAGGTQVVIEGKRFLKEDAGTTRVLFGNTAVTVVPVSDEELWCVVPPGVTVGAVDVTVINDHGTDVLVGGFAYELDLKTKPKAEKVSPERGPLTGGTPVVIEGERFLLAGHGPTVVLFGTERVVVTPVSDERIEVTAPPGLAAGKVPVRVVNDHGMDDLADAFEYEPSSARLVFSPVVGRHEAGWGGTKVTLETSFAVTASSTVLFDGEPAASVAALDTHHLLAEVPDVGDGLVDVTVTEGASTATQAGFRVQGSLSYGDLLLNELLPDASGLDANGDGVISEDGDEFVELVNTTSDPIDVSGLLLSDSGSERHRFPNPTTIPAGGCLVVFGGGTPRGFAALHASGHAQAATSGKLGLSDDADEVLVRSPSGLVLVHVIYDDSKDASSWNRKTDGDSTSSQPALLDDKYKRHDRVDATIGAMSPGRRATGAPF
jgi:hypothetical protein